jgi:hypothetical protein
VRSEKVKLLLGARPNLRTTPKSEKLTSQFFIGLCLAFWVWRDHAPAMDPARFHPRA